MWSKTQNKLRQLSELSETSSSGHNKNEERNNKNSSYNSAYDSAKESPKSTGKGPKLKLKTISGRVFEMDTGESLPWMSTSIGQYARNLNVDLGYNRSKQCDNKSQDMTKRGQPLNTSLKTNAIQSDSDLKNKLSTDPHIRTQPLVKIENQIIESNGLNKENDSESQKFSNSVKLGSSPLIINISSEDDSLQKSMDLLEINSTANTKTIYKTNPPKRLITTKNMIKRVVINTSSDDSD